LKQPAADPALLEQRPIVNPLHFPQLAAGKQGGPPIHELVENGPHALKIEQAWIGDGSLTLPVCRGT
jgi:acetoacetate decarboxylase